MFLLFLSSTPSLFSQTNPDSRNALPQLSPPYAEMPPTFWEEHGTAILIAGLGIILLVAFVVWLCLRPKPKVILPPEVQARNELELLRGQPEDGALLSHVSQILRHYFIAAFQLAPGEPTTTEFCGALSAHEQIGSELAAVVTDFLKRGDEQKFSTAKSPTSLNVVNHALALVENAEARRVQIQLPPRA